MPELDLPKETQPKKPDKVLLGLRALCEEQTLNGSPREYTSAEIAERCGCSMRWVEALTDRALASVRRKLRTDFRELDVNIPEKKFRSSQSAYIR